MPSPAKANPPLLVIVGPTAVGKTELALRLAEALAGEVISADSRYLYRGLDIGTAKPTTEEMARVPHHLVNVTTPDQTWTLAEFQAAAQTAIASCYARQKLPILTGGTGQYIRAVLEGWQPPPIAGWPTLRPGLEALLATDGLAHLVRWLTALDPAAAESVDLRNPRRVIRALEVTLTTGRPFTTQRHKQPPPYRVKTIGLTRPRPELYARVDARIDAMLAAGLEAEVRDLLTRYDPSLPAMSSLGYPQMVGYLQGQYDLVEAVRRIQHDTRRLVRNQANWFRPNDPAIDWLHPDTIDFPALLAELQAWQTVD